MSTTNIIYTNLPEKFPNWTPKDGGALVWFDATDEGSITESGGFVSQWNDKSGHARHISNANGAEQPIRTSNAISFTGSEVLFNMSPFMYENGAVEVYIVASAPEQYQKTLIGEALSTESIKTQYVFRTGITSSGKPERIAFWILDDAGTNKANTNISSGAAFDETPNLCWWRDWINPDGSKTNSIFGRTNGQSFNGADYARTTCSTDTFSVGALNGSSLIQQFTGNIHEIIVTNDLTPNDLGFTSEARYKMEGYLAWKWGFVPDLISNHPYKNIPPTLDATRWTPSDITTQAWYDASDTNTITDVGGAVTQLDDKSGNNRDMVQTTGSAQPILGRTINDHNALDFSGTAQWLECNIEADQVLPINDFTHVFSVIKRDADKYADCIFMAKDGSTARESGRNYSTRGTSSDVLFAAGFVEGSSGDTGSTGRYQDYSTGFFDDSSEVDPLFPDGTISYHMFDRTSSSLYHMEEGTNGSDLGSRTGNPGGISQNEATWVLLGSHGSTDEYPTRLLDGLLGEVIFVTGEITTETRQKMEGYLAWKWGLTFNLPSDHPYKIAPPTK